MGANVATIQSANADVTAKQNGIFRPDGGAVGAVVVFVVERVAGKFYFVRRFAHPARPPNTLLEARMQE